MLFVPMSNKASGEVVPIPILLPVNLKNSPLAFSKTKGLSSAGDTNASIPEPSRLLSIYFFYVVPS